MSLFSWLEIKEHKKLYLGNILFIHRGPVMPPPQALLVAMAISTLLHTVIFSVTFTADTLRDTQRNPQLEVILVNAHSESNPVKADAVAQLSLNGGGNAETELEARTNTAYMAHYNDAQVLLKSERIKQLEEQTQKLMELADDLARQDVISLPMIKNERTDDAELRDRPDTVTDLRALKTRISKDWNAYQKLPKRKFVGARTDKVAYAEYVNDWRERIERVGTENFPLEAIKKGVYGRLLVTVSIRSDGSVESVEVDRSSGYKFLDKAVRLIVKKSEPFPPFSAEMSSQTDILSITRNWLFTRNDLVISERL